jgi:hypothetical protein
VCKVLIGKLKRENRVVELEVGGKIILKRIYTKNLVSSCGIDFVAKVRNSAALF